MGAGSVLVPGSNDGLILVGFPLLRVHAWAALASMAAVIYAALIIQRRIATVAAKPKLA
jgi:toxin CptA